MNGSPITRSVRFSVVTDPGAQDLNEDACAAVDLDGTVAILVADGVGGQARGEVASQLVIETARAYLVANASSQSPADLLRGAFERAQRAIRDQIESSARFRTMRTTLLIALLGPDGFRIGHVGDCRAYLVRDTTIEQLTRDDTFVQMLVDMGELDREGARTHSKSNVLTQSMGDATDLDVHIGDLHSAAPGDTLVVCSDGLSDVLDDAAVIANARGPSPEAACEALLREALARKAQDNVTVAVAEWRHTSLPPAAAKGTRRGKKKRRDDAFLAVALAAFVLLAVAVAAAIAKRRGSAGAARPPTLEAQ
jgi:protein phosphatase